MQQQTAEQSAHKSFNAPDEVREFPLGQAEILEIGGGEVGRYTVQPGWSWSEHIKPIAGTELCEAPHFQFHVSGTLGIREADGSEFEIGPGEVSMLPPGHDAWVVGNEPVVVIDWGGAHTWAKADQ
ncbi:MAG: cupin domain-containing protein [Gaiellaceae bacterium]